MADIKVDWKELHDKSVKMGTEKDNIRTAVRNIETEVNNLKEAWQSNASDNMLAEMEAMDTVFTRYDKVVEEYIQFLENTAQLYEETEGGIAQSSNALKFT